ncbi:MAG: phospholipase D-like domain-containing protein [Candidatus Cyclonatronum sp.]|uniref:phospholipase D-like domain-containing protein n=1 Tax=Cyclonatronum sp. TaxID=3024185 RepID=UPI0025B919A1|nr:phospholipase D-like domain-containing protein [Cyclonatronum sp.]MCH8486614.1 phospholipase D-like domain-containing protein [Cyclonatronum sp.]
MMKFWLRTAVLACVMAMPAMVQAQLFEDMEQGVKGGYAAAPVDLSSGTWFFSDALIGTDSNDRKNGTRSARIRAGFIEMNFDYPNGMSEVTFYAANSGFANDTGGVVQVSVSTNGGSTWQPVGPAFTLSNTLEQYTVTQNIPGNVRLRFDRTAGNRINVDDVLITDYVQETEEPVLVVRINDAPFQSGGTFDFGTTTGSGSVNLRLRNEGQTPLEITNASVQGDAFSIEGDLNVTLGNLETATVSIVFDAPENGVYSGSLSFETNDPEQPAFTINLSAETLDTSEPLPIAVARSLPQGTVVTVAGRVTVADQFAGPVYFQDETGGIAWYSDEIMRQDYLVGAIIGDSLVVTGQIGNFNQLLQVINHTSFEVFNEANDEVEPADITLAQLNSGDFEGQLVRLTDVTFTNSGVFSGGTNYTITDGTAESQLRVDNFTNIPGALIPNSLTEITGVAGRFLANQQILPRFRSDIRSTVGPIIATAPPYTVTTTANSITLEWETEAPGHTEVRYGLTSSLELGTIVDATPKTFHSVTIDGLWYAETFEFELRSAAGQDTSVTSRYLSSTASPAGSTGEIIALFNQSVAHELALFTEAQQNVNFADRLIEFINAAEVSAEFAFYSISGAAGNAIGDAIIAAHQRGVQVRVIGSNHTGNTNAVITRMQNAGVPAVQANSIEQMHNKFAVIDAFHQDYHKTWVVTSSWNATDDGTNNQFQNMLNIQDVALARSYWREFNQMWGAESGAFRPNQARFSADKKVVNASSFWIGEDQTYVQLYFSPQGSTEAQINRTLATAQESIDLNLNLITRRPISNTMLSRFNQGVNVRGVIGQIAGQGSEWDYLSGWADVHHLPQGEFGLLHHKTAIVDGEQAGSNATVITGSHNWSANANFSNDENTLIIRSSRLANEYFQEFAARYWQAGGEDTFNVPVNIDDTGYEVPMVASLSQNYPNPFNPTTNLSFELPNQEQVTINVYDITGRVVATLVRNESMSAGRHTVSFDASRLASGVYLYSMQLGSGQQFTRKMTLIK